METNNLQHSLRHGQICRKLAVAAHSTLQGNRQEMQDPYHPAPAFLSILKQVETAGF